jgi:hypothetical protein
VCALWQWIVTCRALVCKKKKMTKRKKLQKEERLTEKQSSQVARLRCFGVLSTRAAATRSQLSRWSLGLTTRRRFRYSFFEHWILWLWRFARQWTYGSRMPREDEIKQSWRVCQPWWLQVPCQISQPSPCVCESEETQTERRRWLMVFSSRSLFSSPLAIFLSHSLFVSKGSAFHVLSLCCLSSIHL